jgi:hypothetical protein
MPFRDETPRDLFFGLLETQNGLFFPEINDHFPISSGLKAIQGAAGRQRHSRVSVDRFGVIARKYSGLAG